MEKRGKKEQTNHFFFSLPQIIIGGFFGKEQIRIAAVFVIIRLERLPSCNSITAAGIVGNAMQIAPKALERKANVQCEKDTLKYSSQLPVQFFHSAFWDTLVEFGR